MTKIPSDDISEELYKLRIRESEKLKTVLELFDLEIHQKNIGPDYHRLKTMVKRSIEQDLRNKNFGARKGNYERNAVVKNPSTTTAWPGGWGPQRRWSTGGGGLVRVPNVRVCEHLFVPGWHTQGEKDELTSCRGTV